MISSFPAIKKIGVLSGGEKVRCMLSKMMLSESNVLNWMKPTTSTGIYHVLK